MKPTRPKSYKLPKHSSQAQRIADEDLTDEEPIPWPNASVTNIIGGDDVNGNGNTPSNEETVPGPGAIAGMSPFAKQAKQCRGPVVSRSKQCIELRKKMNRSQEKKVSKMVNKLKKQQKIDEAFAGGKGETKGEAGSGEAKTSTDIAGVAGSAQGRLAGPYNNPNQDNVVASNGLVHINTAGPTLTSITQEMLEKGIDPNEKFAIWKYANARDSSNRLGSSIYALRNPEGLSSKPGETPGGRVEQWRNGDNRWLSRVGGSDVFFRDLDESPNRMSWWRNNWKQRTLNEIMTMGGNFKTTDTNSNEDSQQSKIAGPWMPLAATNPTARPGSEKRYKFLNRLRRRRKLGEALDIQLDKNEDPFDTFDPDDRPGGWWGPVPDELKPAEDQRVVHTWQDEHGNIWHLYPNGITVRQEIGGGYHYHNPNGRGQWYYSPQPPGPDGLPRDGSKPLGPIEFVDKPWRVRTPHGPDAINPRTRPYKGPLREALDIGHDKETPLFDFPIKPGWTPLPDDTFTFPKPQEEEKPKPGDQRRTWQDEDGNIWTLYPNGILVRMTPGGGYDYYINGEWYHNGAPGPDGLPEDGRWDDGFSGQDRVRGIQPWMPEWKPMWPWSPGVINPLPRPKGD